MDDITLLKPLLGTIEHEITPTAAVERTDEAEPDANVSASTVGRDGRALGDWPSDVELVLRWAREVTWVGLDGPPDPGTLPGVMAFKRPPARQFVPCSDGSPMAGPRPAGRE